MKIKLLTVVAFSFLYLSAEAQNNNPTELKNQAIELMDNSQLDESIELLKQAIKLAPKDPSIAYEMGFAYYQKGDYQKALATTAPLTKGKHTFDLVYQIRGNSYDMLQQPEKAIKTYEAGLKKFPNSGSLYLELGVMMLKKDDANKGLEYFEKGIEVDPTHPSNYYWACKLFLNSNEKVWGMLYGEIFRNLETNSQRSSEIAQLLYDQYKNQIKFTSDTTISISFSKNNVIGFSNLKKGLSLPFGTTVYEPTLAMSTIGQKSINLASLNEIRSNFIQNFYQKDINKRFDNVLFQWQQTLQERNLMEAYNYWLLSHGNNEEYNKWMADNEDKFKAFAEWYSQNGFPLSEDNMFHRKQIESATLKTGL